MGSLHSFCARIGTMNLRKVRAARQRAADVSSAEPSFFCRQDAGSTLRFMESFDVQDWTRIGTMNHRKARRTPEQRAAYVSAAEPSFFCRQDAGSTLRFMESVNLQDRTRIEAMNLFVRRKPKRQRTGAVQDLAEARKHLAEHWEVHGTGNAMQRIVPFLWVDGKAGGQRSLKRADAFKGKPAKTTKHNQNRRES